jgi:transcription antitermination factor NusG
MQELVKISNSILDSTPKWYAVYTMYKSEKMVAKNLAVKGIECYLPLRQVTKRYTRKIRHYEVPLINCYVFVCITNQEKNTVLETEHVLKFLKVGKEISPIRQEEIDLLKRVEGKILDVEVKPWEYTIGDEVEICQGALVGMRGTLLRRAGKKIFSIGLVSMGLQLEMNVEVSMLRKRNRAI